MARRSVAGLLAWALASATVWAADVDYRLAGIIVHLDNGERRAVIERTPGDQRIYGVADEVDGNRIEEIGDLWVRIRFSDGDRELSLTGAGGAAAASPAPDAEAPDVGSVAVTSDLVERLRSVAGRRGRSREDKAALEDLNAAFGLPARARVVSIDHEPVESTAQVIERLEGVLREGRVPTKVTFEDPSGKHIERYFAPDGSGTILEQQITVR